MDRRTIGYIAAVAGVLTLVWAAMVGYAAVQFFNFYHLGFSSCLPDDFPGYPGARIASVVVSDEYGDCLVQYSTGDSGANVMAFFETSLDQGDWTVTDVDDRGGTIQFERVSDPYTQGQLRLISLPGQTQFQVDIQSG